MSGEHFPKETQRMCNGASGQVPISGVDRSADDGAVVIDPNNIMCSGVKPHQDDVAPMHRAMDASLLLLCESIDMANQHGLSTSDVLKLAQIAADTAVRVYAAQTHADALRDGLQSIADAQRETNIEVAGAISEHSTDLGAGFVMAIEKILKTFPNENTDND